ncbi:MAG: D-amino-acid transaminase [Proteobacteria bacterium]|nr:D-amino-acid transaminase [Pseudomonadota bacterium]
MSRIAYVNGRYVPHALAQVHIDDRGYQFGDGIYEVCAVRGGAMVDDGPHLDRLDRSLREMRMTAPMSRAALKIVMRETIRRNLVKDGIVYLQMTRGVAPRDHAFPKAPETQVVVTARNAKPHPAAYVEDGVKAVTAPDIRWARRDIKTISLLPNCMAKQVAKENGAYEAILVDANGVVTEGSSSNAWIVTSDGKLVTRPASNEILNGITRLAIIEIARREGIPFEERAFTLEELRRAREAFVTSASSFAMPITQIDDAPVANGKPGTIALKVRAAYMQHMAAQAGSAA